MEWAKLGMDVLRVVYSAKSNAELSQTAQERDQYKREAERLKSQLNDKNRQKSSGDYGYKRNFHEHKSDTNRGNSQAPKNFSKPFGQNQYSSVKAPFGDNRGNGYNNSGRGTNHSSTYQKRSGQNVGTVRGTFVGTFTLNDTKAKAGASNFSSSRGRGGSHGRGRGGGRGNAR